MEEAAGSRGLVDVPDDIPVDDRYDLVARAGDRFDTMIAAGELVHARQLADRMVRGHNTVVRARGKLRLAIVAVFDGQFAAAIDALGAAIDDHRSLDNASDLAPFLELAPTLPLAPPLGAYLELAPCLELARALAGMLGDRSAERQYTSDLADTLQLVGDHAAAAATRYELALLSRTAAQPMPAIDTFLDGLPIGVIREVARRRMLRAAAVADCGAPRKAVAAGFSPVEDSTAPLIALGTCAARLREFELAHRSFERATQIWSSARFVQPSAYHAVLARFQLANVLVELGDLPAARAHYEAFVRAWGHADRPIAEIADARRILAALPP